MVPTAVADRYKERASAAEKKNKELAAKIATLEKRVEQLSREKEDLRRSMLPPPPAEDEEVLQMLEPVLAEKIE
jgi:chromosome segregation ATPase